MTKEEQIDWLCRLRAELNSRVIDTPWNKEFTEALTSILEQKPCEPVRNPDQLDCVSKKGVAEVLLKYAHDPVGKRFAEFLVSQINTLPPVSSSEKPNKWIPLKTRPMTDEESTFYRDWAEYGAELFDCHLPDDGQEVLVSWGGNVCIDTFVKDDRDGCYFEGVDIDEVDAWMPLPEPYKAEGSEE